MSVFVSGRPLTQWTKLSDSNATTCFEADSKTTIVSIACTESGGNTPNLTVSRVTTAPVTHAVHYKATMTARSTELVDRLLVLDKGDTIKVTSSNAGGAVDVEVTYLTSSATAGGDHH